MFEKNRFYSIPNIRDNKPILTVSVVLALYWRRRMQKFNFTKDTIEALKIRPKRYSVFDSKTPNLQILIYPSGVKTFVLARKVNEQSQRIKIGRCKDLTVEMARKEAIRLNALIALGQDIQSEKQQRRKEPSFKELYELYYTEYAVPFTKRPKENRKTMELHVMPAFGKMKAIDITFEKMRRFHVGLAQIVSKSTANRIVSVISPVFNFCIKNSYFKGSNPCAAVKKFREISRDRFLTLEELKKYFEAVEQENELFRDFFILLPFTGARKSTVKAMKWSDIDFKNKRWRICERESKNGDVNVVVLCEPALEVLNKRHQKNSAQITPSPYVFPGDGKNGYLDDPKRAFDRIRERAGISNFCMHDLRRTLGSYMAISGASLPIIGKALNHKSQISTAIYARLSQEPVLNAVNTAVNMITDSGITGSFKQNCELLIKETKLIYVRFCDL